MTITQNNLSGNSIIAPLIPFIFENYPYGVYVFWSDLSSPHYSKIAQGFLEAEKFKIAPIWVNLRNLLNTRPIKGFGGILKQKVYKNSCC